MTIRRAELEDLPRLAGLAKEFYAASKFIRRFQFGRFVEAWRTLFQNEIGAIWLLEDEREIIGMLGGVIYPDWYSGDPIATEFFWYVSEQARGEGMKLYRAFEQWARERGCVEIRMIHLMDSMPEKLSRVYSRMGYQQAEQLYVKQLEA